MPTVASHSTETLDFPIPRTSIIGRERERAQLDALLTRDDVSLITMTGPGGVGKTRLAIQIAADVADRFTGSIRFVSLAAVHDPDLVVPAIAQAAGLVALSGRTPKAGLQHFLTDRDYLLILDNFEQVIAAATDIGDLLAICPRLKVIVTSRESLRIANEQEFLVRPLQLPEGDIQNGPPTCDAMDLFVQRAMAVRPDFAMTEETAASIAEICTRLDGLPLAIELAASRAKLMSPKAMLARLVDRFTLLSRDSRDVPARLRTMRDAVGWSYDLLTDEERSLFRRLSIFPGGFTIEAAEAISIHMNRGLHHPISTAGTSLLDDISSLVDKSLLIQTDHLAAQPRFSMLETIRAFGLEQLEAHGEAEATQLAMAAWLIELTEPAYAEQFGPRQRWWSDLLEAEYSNLRAVLSWSIAREDIETARKLIIAALRFWHISGRFAEGRTWAEQALAVQTQTPSTFTQGSLVLAAGWLAFYEGKIPYALHFIEQAVTVAREAGDAFLISQTCHAASQVVEVQGRFADARAYLEEALELYRACGDSVWPPHVLNSLGHAAYESGDLNEASVQFSLALDEFRASGNTYGEGIVLTNMAKIARARGDYNGSIELFQSSLRLRWDHMDRLGIVGCLRGLATAHALAGHLVQAARLYGACETLRDAIGASLPMHHTRYLKTVELIRSQLGEDAFHDAWNAGRATPLEQIVAQAISENSKSFEVSVASTSARSGDLTKREIEVLKLVKEGLTNRRIGEQLFVSERTAQTHVQHILDKLDVSTRAAAVSAGIDRGLI